MTKLQKKPPKYSRNGKYAVAYIQGKKHYLGLYKSPESMTAYARLTAEIRDNTTVDLPKGEPSISVLEHLRKQIENVESEIKKLAYEEENVRLLMTLPGVDYNTATAIVAAFGDISRFKDADHAASYLGLVE